MDGATVDRLLAEQRRYYRERAPEYDDWWFRRGAYALDTETAARWFADVPPGPGSGPGTSSAMQIA